MAGGGGVAMGVGWLAVWLAGCLASRQAGWQAGWLSGCLAGRFFFGFASNFSRSPSSDFAWAVIVGCADD